MTKEEFILSILRTVDSVTTQNNIAQKLNCSVGKVNGTIQKLVADEFICYESYTEKNKTKKRYILTPIGKELKMTLTQKILKLKRNEIKALEEELMND